MGLRPSKVGGNLGADKRTEGSGGVLGREEVLGRGRHREKNKLGMRHNGSNADRKKGIRILEEGAIDVTRENQRN